MKDPDLRIGPNGKTLGLLYTSLTETMPSRTPEPAYLDWLRYYNAALARFFANFDTVSKFISCIKGVLSTGKINALATEPSVIAIEVPFGGHCVELSVSHGITSYSVSHVRLADSGALKTPLRYVTIPPCCSQRFFAGFHTVPRPQPYWTRAHDPACFSFSTCSASTSSRVNGSPPVCRRR